MIFIAKMYYSRIVLGRLLVWSTIRSSRHARPTVDHAKEVESILYSCFFLFLGRLFAVSLAQRGAKVVIWDVDKEGMETTKEMVENHGGSIATYAVDLRYSFSLTL